MTENEYKQFVDEVYKGNVLLGVDRAFARQLFTGVSIKTIEEKTGETPYLEKAIVAVAFLGGPLALLASLILAIFALKWWAVLAVPICVTVWLVYHGMSCRGDAGILFVSFLLLGSIVLYFSSLLPNNGLGLLVSCFLLSLWLSRFLYWGSTFFLRAFVLRSYNAFVTFGEGLRIAKPHNG